jgi:CheY-like chemotaxis protein
VLIVDDDEDIRRLLCRALPAADVQVAGEVTSGEEALEWLEGQSADIVVIDIQMPGLGGVATTKRIRQSHPATVVLGFTGWGTLDKDDLVAAGAAGVFNKTDIPGLIEAIRGLAP